MGEDGAPFLITISLPPQNCMLVSSLISSFILGKMKKLISFVYFTQLLFPKNPLLNFSPFPFPSSLSPSSGWIFYGRTNCIFLYFFLSFFYPFPHAYCPSRASCHAKKAYFSPSSIIFLCFKRFASGGNANFLLFSEEFFEE